MIITSICAFVPVQVQRLAASFSALLTFLLFNALMSCPTL